MQNQEWRARLIDAVEKDKRSDAKIGRDAGMGRTYIHSITKEGKDPGIESLIAVCDTLGVSLSYVLYGVEIDAETEELLSLIQNNPKQRAGILQILKNSESQ